MSQKKPYLNESGITPSGNRVIVKPDDVEKVTEGGIIIPDAQADSHQGAQSIGTLIAVGPDSWSHITEKVYRVMDNQLRLAEVRKKGYSQAFAEPGDRVAFAKFGGLVVVGEDGDQYRILNDEDITAQVNEGVSFSDMNTRKRVGVK
jgi:chaperonin GroES